MAARPHAELHSPGLRRPRLCWLLLAAALAGLPAAADYPRIAELGSRDVLYRQLQEDLQSYFRWVSRQQAKTVGYIRMLTRSHRFVVSVQARKFTPLDKTKGGD